MIKLKMKKIVVLKKQSELEELQAKKNQKIRILKIHHLENVHH